MLNFKKTKSIHPQQGNEISNPPGTLDLTQRDERDEKVCKNKNISQKLEYV